MIAMTGNRPVLQVGRHQVSCYDSAWLVAALERAAVEADLAPFPCLDDIGAGVFHYLETKCPLELLPIDKLQARVRRMLEQVGCAALARHLGPFAPPVTLSLLAPAQRAGCGFELGFFEILRAEVAELRQLGAAAIRFTDHRPAIQRLAGSKEWDRRCEQLFAELEAFLDSVTRRSFPDRSAQVTA